MHHTGLVYPPPKPPWQILKNLAPVPPDRRALLGHLLLGQLSAAMGAFLSGLNKANAWESSKAQDSLQAFLDGVVAREKFPGLSLAVGQQGKLVHAVVSGMADTATQKPVTTSTLFRIASLSKPLTALVIAKLFEREKIAASTPIHSYLGLPPAKDPRWEKITIEHCLQHSGGWDRAQSFDPMFHSATICQKAGIPYPAMPWDIIRHMLEQPLDFDPGSRYAYSNFGYCLLGRVIEKATGMPYEESTRKEILAPLGITSMRLGKTLRANSLPQEATYHDAKARRSPSRMAKGPDVEEPYGAWCLEAMDAHGGWVASATDLLRWAMVLNPNSKPVLLKAESMSKVVAKPSFPATDNAIWYGWGWQVREVKKGSYNLWHTGSLPGTGSILVRRHDGLSWAILTNTNANPAGKSFATVIDGHMHKAVDQARPLAQNDLFQSYGYKMAH